MNYLSKEDLNNLLKISKLLDNNEISQLINLNNKINLNEGNILGSLKKINSNKDLIFKIKEKYDIVENDLEKIKKLVSIFGNDYDIFSYLIKFPNKIDDDSLKNFFKTLSEREEPINYLKKIIEELNTLNGGEDIFLDTYDNMTFKKIKLQ